MDETLINTLDLVNPIGSPQPLDLLKSSMEFFKGHKVSSLWLMRMMYDCQRKLLQEAGRN